MIRRKFVSPISAFSQGAIPIKRKHEFFVIRAGQSEQAEMLEQVRQLMRLRVYDAGGKVIQTHEHQGDFKEW